MSLKEDHGRLRTRAGCPVDPAAAPVACSNDLTVSVEADHHRRTADTTTVSPIAISWSACTRRRHT